MSDGTPKNDPATSGPFTASPAAPVAAPAAVRSRIRRFAAGIAAILAVFAVWQVLTALIAYTDDGYVTSDLIAVAPEVTGVIARLAVADNQDVRKGDLLAVIDPTPFRLAVAERQAALQAASAGDDTAAGDAGNDGAASAGHDVAGGAANATPPAHLSPERLATIAEARASLDLAQWRLAATEIRAPVDGTVNNLTVGVGETAQAGRPLIGIVDAKGWRIVANYKEDYISAMRPGQTAWVWLDTHPWRFHRARIDSVARAIGRSEAGQDRLLPYVAPTTDWIRLKRRFPVTLSLVDPPPGLTLFMGADARVLIFR